MVVIDLEAKDENINTFMKYMQHSQSTVAVITSGIAGRDKVSGLAKPTKMELKQKDTSFTYGVV